MTGEGFSWREFRPTVFFLLKFFALYLGLSWAYGAFIGQHDREGTVDPFTRLITQQCAKVAETAGYETYLIANDHQRQESLPEQTYDSLWFDNVYAISVEEGCNGLNIMILFLAFVLAFGGPWRRMLWFIPLGFLFIHLANIARLMLLSLLNVEWSGQAFHFFHKYGFTAVLYAAVLFLWFLLVTRVSKRPKPVSP